MNEISVVVPMNDLKYLDNVINNVSRQTISPRELVIVINGKPVHKIENLITSNFNFHLKVVTCRKESASAARNVGMKLSSSKYIALMDSDDYWFPEKLEIQLRNHTCLRFPAIQISRSYKKTNNLIQISPANVWSGRLMKNDLYKFSLLRSKMYLPTPSWFFPKDILEKVKFDEKLENREDIKFLLDCENAGYKILQFEEPLVWVNHSIMRALKRETLLAYLRWIKTLSTYSKILAFKYMVGIGLRNLIGHFVFTKLRSAYLFVINSKRNKVL